MIRFSLPTVPPPHLSYGAMMRTPPSFVSRLRFLPLPGIKCIVFQYSDICPARFAHKESEGVELELFSGAYRVPFPLNMFPLPFPMVVVCFLFSSVFDAPWATLMRILPNPAESKLS